MTNAITGQQPTTLPTSVSQGRFQHFAYTHRRLDEWQNTSLGGLICKVVQVVPLLLLAVEQLKNCGIFIANRAIDLANYCCKPRQPTYIFHNIPSRELERSAPLPIVREDAAIIPPLAIRAEEPAAPDQPQLPSTPVLASPNRETSIGETLPAREETVAQPRDLREEEVYGLLELLNRIEAEGVQEGPRVGLEPDAADAHQESSPVVDRQSQTSSWFTKARTLTALAAGAIAMGAAWQMNYLQSIPGFRN